MFNTKNEGARFEIPDEWRISKHFLGERFLKQDKFERLREKAADQEYMRKQLSYIFEEYIEKLQYDEREIHQLFLDFMSQVLHFSFAKNFDFKKSSCLVEIAYHVYRESFENRMNSDKSFDLMKKILVRHSLFRPPISIKVFDLGEIKAINAFMVNTFYRHYDLYFFANTPFVNVEIRSFNMFKARFPFTDALTEAKLISRTEIPQLQEYLIDRETGLTPEQLEAYTKFPFIQRSYIWAMKGDNVNLVPPQFREEWMRLKRERERQAKIDKAIQKEVTRLNKIMETKMAAQDEQFMETVQNIKNPKKK